MMTNTVLIIITCFWTVGQVSQASTGGFRLSSNLTLEAEEGENVTLTCRLQPPINLQGHIFDVKRPDLKGKNGPRSTDIVFVYGREEENQIEQLDQYRNRISVVSEDLRGGTLSVIVSSVQLSDSGKYKMFVPKLKASCFIDLTVVKKEKRDDLSTTELPRNVHTSNRRALTDFSSDAQRVDWKTVGSIVAVVVLLVLVVVAVVLYFLDKHEKIQICKKTKNRKRM